LAQANTDWPKANKYQALLAFSNFWSVAFFFVLVCLCSTVSSDTHDKQGNLFLASGQQTLSAFFGLLPVCLLFWVAGRPCSSSLGPLCLSAGGCVVVACSRFASHHVQGSYWARPSLANFLHISTLSLRESAGELEGGMLRQSWPYFHSEGIPSYLWKIHRGAGGGGGGVLQGLRTSSQATAMLDSERFDVFVLQKGWRVKIQQRCQ